MAEPSVIIITGTSRGIGRALVEHYLGKGWRVFGCSRSQATIEKPNYHHTELDISDESAIRAWIRTVNHEGGRIDALISNAGAAPANALLTATPGDLIRSTVETNILGTIFLCREVAKIMLTQGSGRIITISSMALGLHQEGTALYSATKSAIVEMTKILAKELAPAGITCNTVAPSMIRTEAVAALGSDIIEKALGDLTIRREVTIPELCHVIDFFLAEEGAAITGQVIHMGLVT